jgi:outer membrane protein TolC
MKPYVVMMAVACVAAFSVSAQDAGGGAVSETVVLDRKTAIQLALGNNRSFQRSSIDLQSAARGANTSWNQLLPSVSASAGLNHTDRLFSDPVMPGQAGWSFSGSLDASVSLRPGLAYSIRQTQLEYQAQEISFDEARRSLVAQVEKEFYYLLAARSEIEIQRANLDLAQERYEQTRINFENGRTSEVSMLQAQVNAANQEPAYLSTVNAYNRRRQNFLIVLGLDPLTEVRLEGDLAVDRVRVDAADLSATYVQSRSDVQSQLAALEQLQNQRKLTRANGRTPTLTLSAGWNTAVAEPFEDQSWDEEVWSDTATIGLRLSIPLDGFVPGSSTDVSIANAADRIEQGEIQLREITDAARTEIINLVDQLETAWANIELAQLNIELARTAYEMSEEAYRRGTMELLDVDDSQQEYLSAQQSYITNQYEYLAGLIDLRVALGVDELPEKGGTDEGN